MTVPSQQQDHEDTNYSPGKLLISASAGGYGNTNYYFEDYFHGGDGQLITNGVVGVLANGVSASAVTFTATNHILTGTNVAGYASGGVHGFHPATYATDGTIQFSGNSGWWIIETVESFNGHRYQLGWGPQCNYLMWYASYAFGGTNYSNTPIGAVSDTDEPLSIGANKPSAYFGFWEAGKNFGICAWQSRNTTNFQAVGDPFVKQ